MRILWWSVAPWCQSGYANQTDRVTRELAKLGHEVHIAASYGIYGMSMTLGDGRIVHPSCGDQLGQSNVKYLLDEYNYDAIIALHDAWPMSAGHWKGINERVPVFWWLPIDHDPVPQKTIDFFLKSEVIPVPMSHFGYGQLKQHAPELAIVDSHVPHCVNPYANGSRAVGRRMLGIEDDVYLVGMVASNDDSVHPRKGYQVALEAFGMFNAEYPESRMYVHCFPEKRGGAGMDLLKMAEAYEVDPNCLVYPEERNWYRGFSEETMNDLYSSFDVLLSPSLGEGFCVPLIEAQYQGTPVIATCWTAQPELVINGATIHHGQVYWDEHLASRYFQASSTAVFHEIEYYRQVAADKQELPEMQEAINKISDLYDPYNVTTALVGLVEKQLG